MTIKRKAATKKLKPGAGLKAAARKTAKATAKKTTKKASKQTGKKAELKTKPTAASVTAFIDSVENETRKRDAKTLLAMMKKVTGEKPKMWGPSIIGFGSYHYKYESGREGDMPLVGFSPRKANMVLYVLYSLGDDPLLEKLGPYKNGKSCLYVNNLDKVDLKVLEKIVAKSYKTTKANWA